MTSHRSWGRKLRLSIKKKGKAFPNFQNLYYIDKLIKSFENKKNNKLNSLKGSTTDLSPKKSRTFYEHFLEATQSIIYIQNSEKIEENDLLEKKVYLPPQNNQQKKTLIFDLDETLIHCNDGTDNQCDIRVPIKFKEGDIIEADLFIRPNATKCLEKLSEHYEIVIFTASHSCYANIIVNLLDPNNKFITARLYRDSCIQTKEGIFIKDLRIFANRKLKNIAIIDNAFYSYGFNLENGIPILPFYGNKNDDELNELTNFLISIKHIPDIREAIKRYFMINIFKRYATRPEILS